MKHRVGPVFSRLKIRVYNRKKRLVGGKTCRKALLGQGKIEKKKKRLNSKRNECEEGGEEGKRPRGGVTMSEARTKASPWPGRGNSGAGVGVE